MDNVFAVYIQSNSLGYPAKKLERPVIISLGILEQSAVAAFRPQNALLILNRLDIAVNRPFKATRAHRIPVLTEVGIWLGQRGSYHDICIRTMF